jgi:hypothetical protein
MPILSVGFITKSSHFSVTTKHVLVDGMEQSNYLNVTRVCIMEHDRGCEFDPSVDLWIVDLVRLRRMDQYKFTHHHLLETLLQEYSPSPPWKVLLVDYSDQIDFRQPKLFERLKLPISTLSSKHAPAGAKNPHSHVRVALSSIVEDRRYSYLQEKIDVGHRYPIEDWLVGGGPTLHTPYTVRSDIVEAIKEVLATNFLVTSKVDSYDVLCGVHSTPRPMDVIHLWDPNATDRRQQHAARYRDDVSKRVQAMNGTTLKDDADTICASIEIRGQLGRAGRGGANFEYVQALMTSKIVVVAQRDVWEDHYRLMEALSSGTMVLSDDMLSLPRGLENGTSIVLFRDVNQMEGLIRYYLIHNEERVAVAKRGWQVAMNRHRSWHRLEELAFGCPLTGQGDGSICGD